MSNQNSESNRTTFLKANLFLFIVIFLISIFLFLNLGNAIAETKNTLDDKPYWTGNRNDPSYAVAWGDYDNDGYLDLAIGNLGDHNVIYRNDNGTLTKSPVWIDEESQQELLDTEDITFADIDENGWLDLIVANGAWGAGYVALYYNFNGEISTTANWTSSNSAQFMGMDLGDYDNDGDLDLVVAVGGPSGGRDALYENVNGNFSVDPVWQSLRDDACMDVAFIDIDRDGDLDLYFATSGSMDSKDTTQDYVYLYNEGIESGYGVVPDWYSDDDYWTTSLDISDVDLDGDMDVITANGYGNDHNVLVYLNNNGALDTAYDYKKSINSLGISIDVADFDKDGYEDIGIATEDKDVPNYVIKNYNGTFGDNFYWKSSDTNQSHDCQWGDMNKDGYLDLAVANYKSGSADGYDEVYLNVIEYVGDWIVNGKETHENQIIILSGNLTINNGGNLTFKNVELRVNSSYDGQYGITANGEFSILNSKITSKNSSNEFKFLVNSGAKFTMKNSQLSYCGYSLGNDGRSGLTLKTNNAVIENSTLLNNFIGLYLYSSNNNKVANNTISSSQYDFYMISNSQLTTISTSFNGSKVYVSSNSKLTVKNFLEVLVQDVNAIPIENAIVSVKDNGNEIFNGTTDENGLCSWILITDRIYNGNSVATENTTTIEVWYNDFTFDNNPRNVSMGNSHRETFTSEEEANEFSGLMIPIISLVALFLITRRIRKRN